MLWLFAEEWFWMALATALGGLLGWWLRGSRAASERASLEADLALARRSADDAAAGRTRLEVELASAKATGAASLTSLTNQEADKDKVQDGEIARLRAELEAARSAHASELTALRATGAASLSTLAGKEADKDRVQDGEIARLRAELETCRKQHAEKDAELAGYRSARAALNEKLPTFLDGPRGVPDDLKLIKGVGEKLNTLLTSLGIFHFRQIANWTTEEIAMVDEKMENFKGRIVRDEWLPQAKLLAEGKHTEFEAKYGKMGENN